MRCSLAVLVAASLVAGCGGHTAPAAAPAAAPAPAAPARPASGDPDVLRYSAGTGRYRLSSEMHSVTEVMGQTQTVDASTMLLVSATLVEQAGNLAASFLVDSAVSTDAQAGDVGTLRGQTFRSVITALGQAVSFTVPDTTNTTMLLVGESFRNLLPSLPPAPIAAGQTWTDTTNNTQRAPSLTVRSSSIRRHRVVGWETRDGTRALHIATTTTYSVTGEGDSQGQPIQLHGSGGVTSDRFVSAAGLFLGQTSSDSASITVNVTNMGLDVPVRRSQRSTVARLP